MHIQTLPNELLHSILQNCPTSDHLSLLQTCHTLHALAQPLIYETVNIDATPIWNSDRSVNNTAFYSDERRPRLQLLLRTLFHRPELGACIKHLHLCGKMINKIQASIGTALSLADLQGLARRGSAIIPSMNYEAWLASLAETNSIPGNRVLAFTTLLLSYCENLHSLDLEHDPVGIPLRKGVWNIETIGQVSLFDFALANLPQLKIMKYVTQHYEYGDSPLVIVRQFSLSALKSTNISVSGVPDSTANDIPSSSLELGTTKLELLSQLHESSVGFVLSRTPNITSLRLSFMRYVESQLGSFIDCASLGAYITRLKTGGQTEEVHVSDISPRPLTKPLEHLTITIGFLSANRIRISRGGAWEYGRGDSSRFKPFKWGIKGSIGSLKHLDSLKTLEISLPVLMGWRVRTALPLADILPTSLTELRLQNDFVGWKSYEWDVRVVKNLFDVLFNGGTYGNLKAIKYWVESKYMEADKCLLAEMGLICNRVGVRLEVVCADGADSPDMVF